MVEDKLFSTLETTVGRMEMSPRILLADTIGFIDELPSDLLDAFHATLDESLQCDLLLLVVDSSDEPDEFKRKLSTTRREVLERGDESGMNIKVVLTKVRPWRKYRIRYRDCQFDGNDDPLVVSSHDGQGMDELENPSCILYMGQKQP